MAAPRYFMGLIPAPAPFPQPATVAAPVASFSGILDVVDGSTISPTDTSTGTPTSWQWQRSTDNAVWTNFTTNGTQQNPTLDTTEYGYGGTGGPAYIRLIATNAGGPNTSESTAFTLIENG